MAPRLAPSGGSYVHARVGPHLDAERLAAGVAQLVGDGGSAVEEGVGGGRRLCVFTFAFTAKVYHKCMDMRLPCRRASAVKHPSARRQAAGACAPAAAQPIVVQADYPCEEESLCSRGESQLGIGWQRCTGFCAGLRLQCLASLVSLPVSGLCAAHVSRLAPGLAERRQRGVADLYAGGCRFHDRRAAWVCSRAVRGRHSLPLPRLSDLACAVGG